MSFNIVVYAGNDFTWLLHAYTIYNFLWLKNDRIIFVYSMEFDKTRWSCSWNSDQNSTQNSARGWWGPGDVGGSVSYEIDPFCIT